jgi:hypothetical protein
VRQRVDCVGTWREAERQGVATLLVNVETAALFSARADALEAVLEGWRIGRGRPLTWSDVTASGAVSATYSERVQELLLTQNNDASAFAAKVASLKGFRQANADQLRRHLVEVGALDERERLSKEVLVQRVLVRSRGAIERGILTVGDVVAFADRALRLLT